MIRGVLAVLLTSVLFAGPTVALEDNVVTLGEADYSFDGITAELEIPILTGGPLSPLNALHVKCVDSKQSSIGFTFDEPQDLGAKGMMMAEGGEFPYAVDPYVGSPHVLVSLLRYDVHPFVRALYDGEEIKFTFQSADAGKQVFTLHADGFGEIARGQIAAMHSICQMLEL